MKVCDVFEWPPSSCSGSYSGAALLSPDFSQSTVEGAQRHKDQVSVRIQQGDRSWSCVAAVLDPTRTEAVVATLIASRGSTVLEAGDKSVD